MEKVIIQITLLVVFLTSSPSFANELDIPKDVNEAISLEYKEELKNAEKFKAAVSAALKNPIDKSDQFETMRQALNYTCTRTTGGTWLERFGIECQRCAWYTQIGNCTFQPGDQCISERISEFTYTCAYAPDHNIATE